MFDPTQIPIPAPSQGPTLRPSFNPTKNPVPAPTFEPVPSHSSKPVLNPTASPTLEPTTGTTVTAGISFLITATAAPSEADQSALKTTIAVHLGVTEGQIKKFAVAHTQSRRRRLQTAFRVGGQGRRLGYSWSVSFDVQQDLAATPHADSVTWVSSVSTLLSSDTFSSAVVSAVPSALSVSAATALVKNNQGASPAPTHVAQGPDRGGQNEAGVVGGEVPVIGPPIEKPKAASSSGVLVGFIIAGVGAILVLAGGGLAYSRFRKIRRPPPHPENVQSTSFNGQSSAVGKSGGPKGCEEGPVSIATFESQLDFMLDTPNGASGSKDSTANDGGIGEPQDYENMTTTLKTEPRIHHE